MYTLLESAHFILLGRRLQAHERCLVVASCCAVLQPTVILIAFQLVMHACTLCIAFVHLKLVLLMWLPKADTSAF